MRDPEWGTQQRPAGIPDAQTLRKINVCFFELLSLGASCYMEIDTNTTLTYEGGRLRSETHWTQNITVFRIDRDPRAQVSDQLIRKGRSLRSKRSRG